MGDQLPTSADRPTLEYPMTEVARQALLAEIDALAAVVRAGQEAGVPLDDDGIPLPDAGPGLPLPMQAARLAQLDEVRLRCRVVEEVGVAVIGRRVTTREPDGEIVVYELVVPGSGDPRTGRVSADSPFGSALIGRRAGDEVEVDAPAGARTVTIVSIDGATSPEAADPITA